MTHHRKGSITIEFAFSLPIILVLLAAVIEWGWLLTREIALVQVASESAHAGARTRQADGPEAAAQLRAGADLTRAGFDPDDIDVSTIVGASDAGTAITVRVSMDYGPLVGLLPTPDHLLAETTMRLEDQ